jgi:hypothetical protein
MSLALKLFTACCQQGVPSITELMLEYFECDAVHVMDGRVFVSKEAKIANSINVNDYSTASN